MVQYSVTLVYLGLTLYCIKWFKVAHWLCVLGSCATHKEFQSPAPAAGLAFFKSVSKCRGNLLIRTKMVIGVWLFMCVPQKKEVCLYLSVYVVRFRWRRRVAFSLTNVRPVGSKVHISVMQTLNITSQLHATIPKTQQNNTYISNQTRNSCGGAQFISLDILWIVIHSSG